MKAKRGSIQSGQNGPVRQTESSVANSMKKLELPSKNDTSRSKNNFGGETLSDIHQGSDSEGHDDDKLDSSRRKGKTQTFLKLNKMMEQLSFLRTNFSGSRVARFEANFIDKRREMQQKQRQEELDRRETKFVSFEGIKAQGTVVSAGSGAVGPATQSTIFSKALLNQKTVSSALTKVVVDSRQKPHTETTPLIPKSSSKCLSSMSVTNNSALLQNKLENKRTQSYDTQSGFKKSSGQSGRNHNNLAKTHQNFGSIEASSATIGDDSGTNHKHSINIFQVQYDHSYMCPESRSKQDCSHFKNKFKLPRNDVKQITSVHDIINPRQGPSTSIDRAVLQSGGQISTLSQSKQKFMNKLRKTGTDFISVQSTSYNLPSQNDFGSYDSIAEKSIVNQDDQYMASASNIVQPFQEQSKTQKKLDSLRINSEETSQINVEVHSASSDPFCQQENSKNTEQLGLNSQIEQSSISRNDQMRRHKTPNQYESAMKILPSRRVNSSNIFDSTMGTPRKKILRSRNHQKTQKSQKTSEILPTLHLLGGGLSSLGTGGVPTEDLLQRRPAYQKLTEACNNFRQESQVSQVQKQKRQNSDIVTTKHNSKQSMKNKRISTQKSIRSSSQIAIESTDTRNTPKNNNSSCNNQTNDYTFSQSSRKLPSVLMKLKAARKRNLQELTQLNEVVSSARSYLESVERNKSQETRNE